MKGFRHDLPVAERERQARREAERARDETQLLLRFAHATNRSEQAGEIYKPALDAVRDLLGADRCAILLFDESGRMRFQAAETHASARCTARHFTAKVNAVSSSGRRSSGRLWYRPRRTGTARGAALRARAARALLSDRSRRIDGKGAQSIPLSNVTESRIWRAATQAFAL